VRFASSHLNNHLPLDVELPFVPVRFASSHLNNHLPLDVELPFVGPVISAHP
jgi:hypothetical protein